MRIFCSFFFFPFWRHKRVRKTIDAHIASISAATQKNTKGRDGREGS
jgi:hypothetical protein